MDEFANEEHLQNSLWDIDSDSWALHTHPFSQSNNDYSHEYGIQYKIKMGIKRHIPTLSLKIFRTAAYTGFSYLGSGLHWAADGFCIIGRG